MQNVLDAHHSPLKIAAPEPPGEPMPPHRAGRSRFLGRFERPIRAIAFGLVQTIRRRRTRLTFEPLDDHTLNDIGLTRAADWGPR